MKEALFVVICWVRAVHIIIVAKVASEPFKGWDCWAL